MDTKALFLALKGTHYSINFNECIQDFGTLSKLQFTVAPDESVSIEIKVGECRLVARLCQGMPADPTSLCNQTYQATIYSGKENPNQGATLELFTE